MTCVRRPAGARTPAPSTSAGSGRPDAGAGRARLSLLPVLTLLLGALSLFAPAPAEAQTVWKSTLKTTNFVSTRYGCENSQAANLRCTTSNLSPNTFTFNGKQWSLNRLFINDGQTEETLQISFIPAVKPTGADADAFSRLQLRVGSVTFSFQTGDNGAYPLTLGTSRAGNTILGTSLGYNRRSNEQHMQTLLSEFSGGSTIEIELYDPGLRVRAIPACGTAVTDLSVEPVWQLRLTPAPGAETAVDYRPVDVNGNGLGRWAGHLPITTSGNSFETSRDNPFSQFRAAFPGFAGFKFRLRGDTSVEASCTWQFDNSGGTTTTTTPTNNNNGGGTPTTTTTTTNNNGGAPTNTGGGGGGGGGGRPALSGNAALSDLVVTPRDGDGNPGKRLALSPAFAPSATAYTLDVPYPTGTLDIAPGLTGGTAAVGVRSNGSADTFPAANTYTVHLRPGETTVVEVTVTAENRRTTRTYTLSITRAAPNTDPSLPALVVRGNDDSDINLSPAFSPDHTDYRASLAHAVDAVTLTPAVRHTGARVRLGGQALPGGQASAPVPLAVGGNEIILTVTAEDGTTTRAYTLTLARAGADAQPPTADPRALPDLSRALADDTQHSIAARLETARAPGRSGRTAPLSARLTQALAAVLPGQASSAATPAFDPVLAEARVDSGWVAPAAPVHWQALLDNAGASLSLGAAPDAGESPTGESPTGLASLSLWSDGAYRNIGGRHDGLNWHGNLLGARLGLDMRFTPSLTGGAALGWQRAGWSGNAGDAGDAGATRHTLSLLGLHPYAGWQRGRLSAWVSGGLGKGRLDSRYRGEERSADSHHADGYGANGHSANGYSADGYNGDPRREDVTAHTLGGGLAGRLFDTDAFSLGLKAEALATGLATETHATGAHRLRLALDAGHVRRLGNDALLTPTLELGLRRDGGAGRGGLGLEAGGALRYVGGPLTLRGQARTLLGRGGYREWGLSGTAEWRARTDGRGLTLRLAPGLGSAESGIGQLWAQGLRDRTHGTPSQAAARLDASLSYGWDAPGYRGRITPYLELHRQPAAAAWRLGARWDAPGGFSLRLAGERNDGHAGTPADHALLLEGSWRPGR